MIRHLFQIIIVFSFLVFSYNVEGQTFRAKKGVVKPNLFQIPGMVKLDKGDPSGVLVKLINLDSKLTEKSVTIPSSGKFDFELSYFNEYRISITKDGYYDKEIDVSTAIPQNVWEKDSVFPPYYIVVTIYKKVEGATLSFEGKPVGKVSYSQNGRLDNFDSVVLINDKDIQQEISNALNNLDDKDFNQKMAEALEYEKNKDLPTAFSIYSEASKIKPSDKFVKEKLKELASDIKNLGNDAKIQAEYNRLIALGDANVSNQKYNEAIQYFKDALKVKPNDQVAVSKLTDAEKQLALAGNKAIKDAEFNRLIAEGYGNIKATKYKEAIISFKAALDIKPGDSIALARISDAEEQIALAGDKAKKDAEFNRLIAEGDKNVKAAIYTVAISSFKAALGIKPGDVIALARISDAEKQLALAGDKAKKDAEFNRLIAVGDENVKATKYAEAIGSFKGALNVKPGDAIALARISDAEKQLALAGDKAKKDAEFNRLIAVGDENVKATKYAEAIGSFKGALDVKPGDAVALVRISDAEKQLALAGDKAKKDAEFNRLLTLGDASVSVKKYAEALTMFKSALELKNNEIVNKKIAETERLLQLVEADRIRLESERQAVALKLQRYKEAIEKADKLFASKSFPESKQLYQQAIAADPVATYPKDKIGEIDKILAKLLADALVRDQESAKAKLYNEAMIRGGANFIAKQYADAIFAYRDAQKIKPSEILPPQKIKEIQAIVDALAAKALDDQKSAADNKLSSGEKSYLEKIKIADENYTKSQWSVARFYYIDALKFKQGDNYSLEKVDACDKMIDSGITAEKMLDYKNKIDKADNEMNVKNFSSAKFYYRSASDILKWETYPLQQLKEIDRIVAEKLSESDQRLFTESLLKADEAFNSGEYPVARFYYNKAIEISPSDHVTSRLKEIESVVNGSESKKINASYEDFIKKGDEAVKQKNSSIARFYFQKANSLKPNENYPKEELKKIDAEVDNL